MILANGCNITKSEKFKGVWILSVPSVCMYVYIYIYIYIYIYVYILGPYILDTDTILIILALFATRIELKWNNQDLIEVQTLSFNSRGWTKI